MRNKLVVAVGMMMGLWSQSMALPDSIGFDVVIRDFHSSHPDFEAFDARWKEINASPLANSNMLLPRSAECYGDENPPPDLNLGLGYSPTESACIDGYACGSLMPDGTLAGQTVYGEYFLNNGDTVNMDRHAALALNGGVPIATSCTGGVFKNCAYWESPVYVTRGMVAQQLDTSNPDPHYWKPVKLGSLCHNDNFDQWFTDVGGDINQTITTTMMLQNIPGTNRFQIDSYTMPGKKYFPLDQYNGDALNPNFGKETYGFWCPPYGPIADASQLYKSSNSWELVGGYGEAPSPATKTLCQQVNNLGGSKVPTAVQTVATQTGTQALLHNYSYTMAGYTQFTYNPTDTFLFAGDDDMWIFIDGQLVADLGGTHNAAEARIPMIDLATKLAWAPLSKHKLNFYYTERQSDGSDIKITTTMADVSTPVFGAPFITSAEQLGNGTLVIHVSTQLSAASINAINLGTPGQSYFPILGIKMVSLPTGGVQADTMGLAVTSISTQAVLKDSAGNYIYYLAGAELCNEPTCSDQTQVYTPSAGDSLSFNYIDPIGHKFALPATSAAITSIKQKPVNKFTWGVVIPAPSVSSAGNIIVNDLNPEHPPFDISSLSATSGAGVKGAVITGGTVSSLNSGELTLSLYPSDSLSTALTPQQKAFGLPPLQTTTAGSSAGLFAVDTAGVGGYYQSTISNTTNGGVSRCYSVIGSNGTAQNSCLGVNFTVTGSFHLNIEVYDHLGQFVTRYQESASAAQIAALQAKNDTAGATCADPSQAGNTLQPLKSGKIMVSANVYPVSQTGRKLGTGVYILKTDLIEDASTYCQAPKAGKSTPTTQASLFTRIFSQTKEGYIRTSK